MRAPALFAVRVWLLQLVNRFLVLRRFADSQRNSNGVKLVGFVAGAFPIERRWRIGKRGGFEENCFPSSRAGGEEFDFVGAAGLGFEEDRGDG